MWSRRPKRRFASSRDGSLSDRAPGPTERWEPFLRESGIDLQSDQTSRLNIFLDELMLWNEKINLTGLHSRQGIACDLLSDSILPIPFLPDEGTLLDVGSGAGFPAIPIKICRPGLKAQLIEPHAKKVHFLRQVIRLARLKDIEVIQGRLEDETETLSPTGYDVITSRAFVPLPVFLTLCGPHLSAGGCMVAFLGSRGESSIEESAAVMERHRLSPFKRLPYTVPGKGTRREILILKKKG